VPTVVGDDPAELFAALLAATGTCVPKPDDHTTTIHDPSARVYYGTTDTIYEWEDVAETALKKCTGNMVTINVQLTDQALDGTGLPSQGPPAGRTDRGGAGALAQLEVHYSNLALAAGGSYHDLTMVAQASQTDGKTTTAWCLYRSWTYLATLAGPEFAGSRTAKC
jgi:hypothetical protein